jgi:voltage-gated potassium channel
LIANPNGSTQLQAGQRLIVMGSPSQLQAMERLLGEALEDASVLKA